MAPGGPEKSLLYLAPSDGPPFPGDCWSPAAPVLFALGAAQAKL